MRTVIIVLGVMAIAGIAAFAVQWKYSGTEGSDGVALVYPSNRGSKAAETVQIPAVPGAGYDQQKMRIWYDSAARISSITDRDAAYRALVEDAARQGDFELALEISDHISATGQRDSGYASIARQALAAGDFATADKAAEEISSVSLREEQFKKMAGACPSNVTTEGAASVLGLDTGNRAGAWTQTSHAQ